MPEIITRDLNNLDKWQWQWLITHGYLCKTPKKQAELLYKRNFQRGITFNCKDTTKAIKEKIIELDKYDTWEQYHKARE